MKCACGRELTSDELLQRTLAARAATRPPSPPFEMANVTTKYQRPEKEEAS